MTSINLIPIFIIGLLGSMHCIGMCGGIVSAFSMTTSSRRPVPIRVVTASGTLAQTQVIDSALHVLVYNAGRVGSYTAAGALAGSIAGNVGTLAGVSALQFGAYWLTNLMLVALGLYLMNIWRGLVYLETAGHIVWRRIQPLMKHLLPLDSPIKTLMLGSLWGWLPCGMVYSILLTAMLTGSALSGAMVMLAFGLGTLPALFAIGMLGTRLKHWAQQRSVRVLCGLIVLAFGLLGLVRAANGLPSRWIDTICVGSLASNAAR